MIILAAKESSVFFQERFSKYLNSKGIDSTILLLQPFDEFHARKIRCLSFKGFDDLYKKFIFKDTGDLEQILLEYLTSEDLLKLSHTQWLNKDIGRIQFSNVTYHDCLAYLATVKWYYVDHLRKSGAKILFDTDNDNFVRRLLFRICQAVGVKYYILQHSRFEDKVLCTEQQSDGFFSEPPVCLGNLKDEELDNIRSQFEQKSSFINHDDKVISQRYSKKYRRIARYLIGQLYFTAKLQIYYLVNLNFRKLKSHIYPQFIDTWRFNLRVIKNFVFRKYKVYGTRPTHNYVYIPLSFTTEGMDSFASGEFAFEKSYIPYVKELCEEVGMKLYIRDHPHMVMERSFEDELFMAHYADYYENPLVSLSTDSMDILRNASAVITFNGTTSVEAKILGLPVFTVGRSLHDIGHAEGVKNSADKANELELKLKNFIVDPNSVITQQEYQIKRYLRYVREKGMSYNYVSVLRGDLERNEENLFHYLIGFLNK